MSKERESTWGRKDFPHGISHSLGPDGWHTLRKAQQMVEAEKHNLYEDRGFFGLRPNVGPLKQRFIMPPYSVWNTRDGGWQDRRRLWLAKGIQSEEGREGKLTYNIPMILKDGRTGNRIKSQTSIFDPVICELAYGWWCRPGGVVLDPFAGGSVRGIVASVLGYKYLGIELRGEQVEANAAQVNECTRGEFAPRWRQGDSFECIPKAPPCDFFFSCHPAGVPVETQRGLLPIEMVRVGDAVRTHTGAVRLVTEELEFTYNGPLYTFYRDYGVPLPATREHPLFVARARYTKPQWALQGSIIHGDAQGPEWVVAKDVRAGDYLLEPVPKKPTNPIDGSVVWVYRGRVKGRGLRADGYREICATKDLMKLIGYYLAEGHCYPGGIGFAFNSKETSYHKEVASLCRNVFGGRAARVDRYDNTTIIGFYSTIASQFFAQFGTGRAASKKKFLPWFWECSDGLLAEVVRGLWAGDGWLENNEGQNRFAISLCSKNLINDTRVALLRLGIISSYNGGKDRTTGYGDPGNWKPMHDLTVRGVHAEVMGRLVGVAVRGPANRRPNRGPFIKDGYIHYKIRLVVQTEVEELPVYNLEVAHDHSYIAAGVCSHNCPPYGNLEVYSDNPADISNMTYAAFLERYRAIIKVGVSKLHDNRFACFVVANYRGKEKGCEMLDFVGDTIRAFADAGAMLYNDIILINAVGTGAMRANTSFVRGARKVVKSHQNVLVFIKGDPRIAAEGIPADSGVKTGDGEENKKDEE